MPTSTSMPPATGASSGSPVSVSDTPHITTSSNSPNVDDPPPAVVSPSFLPPIPPPSNYSAIPGKLFGWGSAKTSGTSPFPGAKTVDASGHLCFPEQLFGGNKFRQICADTGLFAALRADGEVLVWSSSGREGCWAAREGSGGAVSGAAVSGGAGVAVLKRGRSASLPDVDRSQRAERISVGERSVWVIAEGGRLLEYRSAETSVECRIFREEKTGRAVEGAVVEEVSACGNGVLVIVQFVATDGQLRRRAFARGCGEEHWEQQGARKSARSTKSDDSGFIEVPTGAEGANAKLVSTGSSFFAVVSANNRVFVWGQNKSGNLGLGHRKNPILLPREMVDNDKSFFGPQGSYPSEIVQIDATRGQPNPKNNLPDPTGQEGPRLHIVTADGVLHICGSCHKGLGADHFFKILTSAGDHLTPYAVGGLARDDAGDGGSGVWTGAFERRLKNVIGGEEDHAFAYKSVDDMFFEAGMCFPPASSSSSTAPEQHSLPPALVLNNSTSVDKSILLEKDTLLAAIKGRKKITPPLHSGGDGHQPPPQPPRASSRGGPHATGYLSAVRVCKTACSNIHSFCVTEDGRLFAWGCGSDGRLGLDAFFHPNGGKRLMKCYVSTPSYVSMFSKDVVTREREGYRVAAVAAGKYWSFAILIGGAKLSRDEEN